MTDEELKALVERLEFAADDRGPWLHRSELRKTASAIRQLMREIKLADFEIQLLKMQIADDPMHPLAPS
jgi:hypothetical protein